MKNQHFAGVPAVGEARAGRNDFQRRAANTLTLLMAAAGLAGCAKGKDPPAATPKILLETGTFTMGTTELDPCDLSRITTGGDYAFGCDARDQSAAITHSVTVAGFCIDQHEVTNLQYNHCEENGACGKPETTNVGVPNTDGFIKKYYSDLDKYGEHPVVGVTWENARKYCEFRGGDLPTEAQWEFAAASRGEVIGASPVWADADVTAAVEAGECDSDDTRVGLSPCTDGRVGAVGSAKADRTAQGVFDLGGNVREWVRDEFDFLGYCAQEGIEDAFTLNSQGTRPFFSPDQSIPPAELVTDAACLDDGGGSKYRNGCNPGLLECRGVCTRAFKGEDAGAEKRATWRSEDCRVRNLPDSSANFRVEPGPTCATDCEAEGQEASACAAHCTCIEQEVDAAFNDTTCLQGCLAEYQACAAGCTVPETRMACMEVETDGNDPVLARPVCLGRDDHTGATVHTRPAAFNEGRIKNTHVVRGGAFNEDKVCAGRVARRDFEAASTPLLGFRCAYPASACQ
jgi:formylglycine-generating enzyme required for sulfatase activity